MLIQKMSSWGFIFPIFVNMKPNLLNSGSVLPHLPQNTGKGDQWPEDLSAQILDAHDKYLKIKLKYLLGAINKYLRDPRTIV